MRLLIITQKVDVGDPILGFFHRWIEEFAKKFSEIIVICLFEGVHNLPSNVKVLSLGKEKNKSKILYIINFYKFIFSLKKEYDAVFVHMNQEYILLGGFVWSILGVPIYFWRNHAKGSILTLLSVMFSRIVFCTSPNAFVAKFKKTMLMPVGVDVNLFKPASIVVKEKNFLILGRIAPVKRILYLIDALKLLSDRGVKLTLDIVGDAAEGDKNYYDRVREKINRYKLNEHVSLMPSVPYTEAPELYKKYRFFVNLTPIGSLDKTIFEALASGLITVVVNPFFNGRLTNEWIVKKDGEVYELAKRLEGVSNWTSAEYEKVKPEILKFIEEHKLETLIKILSDNIKN